MRQTAGSISAVEEACRRLPQLLRLSCLLTAPTPRASPPGPAAALILYDAEAEASADNISAILKAAGIEVEPYWPGLFAKLLEKKSIVSGTTRVVTCSGGGWDWCLHGE